MHEIALSPNTHWRYSIIALRILRTLIRRDQPVAPDVMKYFLDATHDKHPSMVGQIRMHCVNEY